MQTKSLIAPFALLLLLSLMACEAPQAPADSAVEARVTTSKLDTMPLNTAISYTTGWQQEILSDTTIFGGDSIFAFTIPRADFADLLKATDSTYNFRAYLGYKANAGSQNNFELMLVAVDANGKDVIDSTNFIYDFTTPCPDQCDDTSPLCAGCK